MDPDFWLRQWDAFVKAPVPCLIFLALGLVAAWWFRGSVDQGETKGLLAQIAGLKEQINAFEQRFKLAGEQEQAAVKARQSAQAATLVAQAEKRYDETIAQAENRRDEALTKLQRSLHDIEQIQETLAGALQPSAGKPGFTVGGRVFHQKFGYGWITSVDGEILSIFFSEAGLKRIMAKYVKRAEEV